MLEKINGITEPYDIVLDFEKDVVPLSKYADGAV